jgi:hypothetical protein
MISINGWKTARIFMALAAALASGACGPMMPRPAEDSKPEVGGEAEASQPGQALEVAGLELAIRVVRDATEPGGESSFAYADYASGPGVPPPDALVSGNRVEFVTPIRWPREPGLRLALEISPHSKGPAGDFSYRCLYADGSVAEDPQREGRIESGVADRTRGSVVVLLEKVFGERGERQDPATRCRLEVRLPGREPLLVSLRVIGNLPEPTIEVLESKSPELAAMEPMGFRVERWSNPSFRRLAVRLEPQLAVESRQIVEQVRYSRDRQRKPGKPSRKHIEHASSDFVLEAAVQPAKTFAAPDWREARSARVILEPGESAVIRFRLAPGPGVHEVKLLPSEAREYRFMALPCTGGIGMGECHQGLHRVVCYDADRLVSTRWVGRLAVALLLEEVGDWGEVALTPLRIWHHEAPAPKIQSKGKPFDPAGFVPLAWGHVQAPECDSRKL